MHVYYKKKFSWDICKSLTYSGTSVHSSFVYSLCPKRGGI